MTKKIIVKTGEKVQISGQYRPSGGRTESTFVKGEPATPNTIGKRQFWTLVDKTIHKK